MADLMTAAVASPSGLVVQRIPLPTPAKEQLLVKVLAAGVNRADLQAARGAGVSNRDAYGKAIGMEWAGEIVSVGEGTTGFSIGELVACSGLGGYADFAVADMGRAIRFDPAKLPVDQAATLPLALMTAHNALVSAGAMSAGDRVLVQGATSAVGLAALRIAALLGASLIAASSTTAAKRARLPEFGATLLIDPSREGWASIVMDATNGRGVDVIVDMVTGPKFNETIKAAAILGRIVNVGRLGGTRSEIDLDYHALRRLRIVGVTFRTRTLPEIRRIVTAMLNDLWRFVEQGELRLPLDRSFPLREAPASHAYMAEDRHFGKIVIHP